MRILLSSPSVGFLTTVTTKTNWMKKDLQLMEKYIMKYPEELDQSTDFLLSSRAEKEY